MNGGPEYFKTQTRLNTTRKALKDWNKYHFGRVQNRIKDLENELHSVLMKEREVALNIEGQHAQIQHELSVQRVRLELIYRKKSRELWLKERKMNSNYFFC